jgi:4-carboxymuconolactone decarboxylase
MHRIFAAALSTLVATCACAQSGGGSSGQSISRAGSQKPSSGPAEFFTGAVTVTPVFPARTGFPSAASVSFTPGARSAWHTHPAGQQLVVTAGRGLTQEWGGPITEIQAGDVIWCPPGIKHWHGAAPDSAMTHTAITAAVDGKNVEWMEKVSDEQYSAQVRAQASSSTSSVEKPSQKAIGDFAPKLAQLTDDVLYGDVWESPQLSKRDRSLVTVSALIALNRPDQLRSHFVKARENGVTQDELIETITHLAFYAGWPNAVTAIGVAREVFEKK